MNLIGAHIDCAKTDLKPNPLYEDNELVLMKTQYYGGIKKYQWAAILWLSRNRVFKDGSPMTICIGENDDEPVFYSY
jgi:aspartyl aminopeptidase